MGATSWQGAVRVHNCFVGLDYEKETYVSACDRACIELNARHGSIAFFRTGCEVSAMSVLGPGRCFARTAC